MELPLPMVDDDQHQQQKRQQQQKEETNTMILPELGTFNDTFSALDHIPMSMPMSMPIGSAPAPVPYFPGFADSDESNKGEEWSRFWASEIF